MIREMQTCLTAESNLSWKMSCQGCYKGYIWYYGNVILLFVCFSFFFFVRLFLVRFSCFCLCFVSFAPCHFHSWFYFAYFLPSRHCILIVCIHLKQSLARAKDHPVLTLDLYFWCDHDHFVKNPGLIYRWKAIID